VTVASPEREGGSEVAIIGSHMLLYSTEPEALRATLRDAFGFEHVDAGHGWLIFALPPAELGVHPADGPTLEPGARHQVTFMCDDIHATVKDLRGKGLEVKGDPVDQRFGVTVMVGLPGGVDVMLYEPRHPMAIDVAKR
jgi:catechol 2,3-dioxygenase-like lactoylglutathione lyase family enzyme